ncbi:Panacea domain-containing protein [Candidatus Pyrohabitans sp.]
MTIENKKLKMVIYYLVSELKRFRYPLTRTKLVKLLFIIDYIAKNGKRMGIGKTITGIKYYYYHHGPFSRKIPSAIQDMQGKEIIEMDIGDPDEFASHYVYKLGKMPRFKPEFEQKEKEIIDFVIRKYGYYSLDSILKLVYNVPEMKKAKPLDIILK